MTPGLIALTIALLCDKAPSPLECQQRLAKCAIDGADLVGPGLTISEDILRCLNAGRHIGPAPKKGKKP